MIDDNDHHRHHHDHDDVVMCLHKEDTAMSFV